MSLYWYALRSKPRKEEVLWRQVQSEGVEIFFPRLRVNPVNPRAKKWKPYFPGYMFVHVDLEELGRSTFRWMPHSLGLVTFGDEPARVPKNLIYAIQRRVKKIAEAGGEVFQDLKKGDEVLIHDGPFEGYRAIFDERLSGNQRVRVLLKLLGERQIPVELRAGQIEQSKKRS